MKKETKFTAHGNVLGKEWGDDMGNGHYYAKVIHADTRSELIKLAEEKLKDGSLDAGADFEKLIGAILVITQTTTVEIDGDSFTNQKSETLFIGDLTDKDKKDLVEDYRDSRK
jgi:hypothetical protein